MYMYYIYPFWTNHEDLSEDRHTAVTEREIEREREGEEKREREGENK